MAKFPRLLRHLFASAARTRVLFSPAVLSHIEAAIGSAEAQHSGEIRFVVLLRVHAHCRCSHICASGTPTPTTAC
jgi:hypothetical protein